LTDASRCGTVGRAKPESKAESHVGEVIYRECEPRCGVIRRRDVACGRADPGAGWRPFVCAGRRAPAAH